MLLNLLLLFCLALEATLSGITASSTTATWVLVLRLLHAKVLVTLRDRRHLALCWTLTRRVTCIYGQLARAFLLQVRDHHDLLRGHRIGARCLCFVLLLLHVAFLRWWWVLGNWPRPTNTWFLVGACLMRDWVVTLTIAGICKVVVCIVGAIDFGRHALFTTILF